MANDQTADEVLASLVEYVGAQMLRVEELSRRSWRYVLVAAPIASGKLGPDMRVSYMQTDRVPDDLRKVAALLEDVAQRMDSLPSRGTAS
jgi:hypothetical protein